MILWVKSLISLSFMRVDDKSFNKSLPKPIPLFTNLFRKSFIFFTSKKIMKSIEVNNESNLIGKFRKI